MLRNINKTIDTEHNAFKLANSKKIFDLYIIIEESGSAVIKKESEQHHSDDEGDTHTMSK